MIVFKCLKSMILATPKPLYIQNTTRPIDICLNQFSYEFGCIDHSDWQAKCESISNDVANATTLFIWRTRCPSSFPTSLPMCRSLSLPSYSHSINGVDLTLLNDRSGAQKHG
jgi:hypothetical protein